MKLCETNDSLVEEDTVAFRIQCVRDDHRPLDTQICFAVLDFKGATEHPQADFTVRHGGVEEFEQQLFLLLDAWRSGARY